MSHHSRIRRLRAQVKGIEEINVGGGRTVLASPQERYNALIDALAGSPNPLLEAIRSGEGDPTIGKFANLILALAPTERRPPSGDPESPWVDIEDPAESALDFTE